MQTKKKLGGLRATAAAIAFIASSQASAAFMPVLDEFWIVKNGTEIYRDSFSDGVTPPSGPDGATTYTVIGPAGMTSESGGKLTMTPSLGTQVAISGTFADVATGGLRNLSTNPLNSNFLGFDSSFQMHALYDLSSLPTIAGQSFELRATDRALGLGDEGNNAYGVLVGFRQNTGEVVVALRSFDFENNISTVLDTVSIENELAGGADQIELILSKDQESDALIASYNVYDGANLLSSFMFETDDPLKIYIGEDFIRAQFLSTDIVAVPEPGTLALVGAGLVGFALRRRRTR